MDLSIAAAPQLPPMRRQPLTDLIRINVLIAERSGLSRRGADAAIAEGRVTSGGRSVVIGERLDPSVALELDGKVLVAAARTALNRDDALGGVRLLAWYKPPGVTTTHSDPHAAVTLPQALAGQLGADADRILSIGRLDRESEGLLLLTTERRIVSRLAHPRAGLRRGYAVLTSVPLGATERARLLAGIRLTDGWARAVEARQLEPREAAEIRPRGPAQPHPACWSFIAIAEGRHHEVRRLYGAIERPVHRLVRIAYGPVRLGPLKVGAHRELTESERAELSALLIAAANQPGA